MQKLLVKLPSRQRHDKLLKVVEMYATMSILRDTRILVTLDEDDGTHELAMQLRKWDIVGVDFMPRKGKIPAVNYGLRDRKWDVVLVASDDMVPIAQGYDSIVLRHMQYRFPDGDGCLWFHDGYQSRVCTLPVMGRKYFDRTGRVYDQGYKSYFADDHMHLEASMLGRLSPELPIIIEHQHPFNTKKGDDPLYRHNRKHKEADRAYFLSQGLGSGNVS